MVKSSRRLSVMAFVALLLNAYLPTAHGHEVHLACPAAFGAVPDASGLIAYYPLDGNTADVSGNGMDAVEENAVRPVEGKVGQGYHFNGKDSFIRLPGDITPTIYPQVTVTAWIKPEAVNGTRYVINQGDHGNRNLFISSGRVTATGSKVLIGEGRHSVFANRWIFVALTYDQVAGTAMLLSDGYFSSAEAVMPEMPRPSILLGAKAPGNSGFAGTIDEVRIYNRALTTTELAGLNRAGNETSVAGSTNPDQLPGDQFGSGNPTQSSAPQPAPVGDSNDAVAYPQTDVFASSNAGNLVADAVGPSSQPGQPLFDESPTQLPGDQFGSVNPTQLPGDQFERPGAEDIPTGRDYQVVDQNVEYVADVTNLVPEPSDGGPSGGTSTIRQPLVSETALAYAPGEPSFTAISGTRGSIVRTLAKPDDVIGFTGLSADEKLDKICGVGGIDECGNTTVAMKIPGLHSVDIGPDHVVGAIQVCTRRSNGRVKGFRVRGPELTSTGIGNTYEQDAIVLPNCNGNWKTLVMCPSGQIAAGIVAHFTPGRHPSRAIAALVGIQLTCRTVVPAS